MDFWASIAFLDTDVQLEAARCADEMGYTGVALPDHLFWAESLEATDVPKSYREARMYFREVRSELTFGDQAQEARDFVLSTTGKSGAEAAAYGLICRAAVGLLPSWARAMLGLGGLGLGDMVADRALVRPVAFGALSFLRWSLGDSEVMNAAKQRVLATPS